MSESPGAIAYAWGLTLVEPLLPTAHRVHLDRRMQQVCETHLEWACAFYGGVIADMVRTLPDDDPWRGLSGRLPDCLVGTPPSDGAFGAWRSDGRQFGAVDDATDLLPAITPDPGLDPGLAALASGLAPTAAALLAFGEAGWSTCRDACLALAKMPTSYLGHVIPEEVNRVSGHLKLIPGARSTQLRDCPIEGLFEAATSALRWACHRRRTHLAVTAAEDTWVTESFHHWAWRADRIIEGRPWPMRQVERAILEARIVGGIGDEF